MSLFERIKNKRASLQEQTTGEQEKKQERKKGADYSDQSDEIAKKKKTKYQQLRDQRTKYNVLKNKKGEYVPSIQSAKAKIGERIRNITQPPNPKATQKNALNASPGRIRKLNKAQRRAAMFEPGAGKERFNKKFDKDYGTRILDRITKNQEANVDTSRKGLIDRTKARIDAKSPTIDSKIIGKDGKPKKLPMPGGPNEVDFKTGGRGIGAKGIRTDQAVINRMGGDGKPSKEEIAKAKKQQAAYDKAAKDLKLKSKVDRPVLGSKSFNLQTQYDDLKINLGGKTGRKRAKNQPTKQQVQSTIDKRYPTKQGKDTRPARFVKGKDGVVRQYGGGRIPDKSSGAYGSANDRVAVSADGKTRIKHPEYEKMKRDARKIKKKYTKVNPNAGGAGGGFSSSSGKKILNKTAYNPYKATKATSRFGRVLTALKKNPKTALAAAAIGTGLYLYNKGKNPPKGIVPPPVGKKPIIGAKGTRIDLTLSGKPINPSANK